MKHLWTGASFSIAHLFVLTTLVAVSLTWPLLAFIVIPLIFVAVLARFGFGSVVALLIAAGLSIIFGIALSTYYWRYPFAQPRLLAELREIAVVEQLSSVSNVNPQSGRVPSIVAINKVPAESQLGWNTPSEVAAVERILHDLGQRGVAINSSQPVAVDLVHSIWHAADKAGILIEGDAGYHDTKTLRGKVGKATLHDGTEILFATLEGDQHSNDHYPYYELVIPWNRADFTISNDQWFFEDISGIEGFNWLAIAFLLFVYLLAPAAIVFGILRGIWRILVRRCNSCAASPAGASFHEDNLDTSLPAS